MESRNLGYVSIVFMLFYVAFLGREPQRFTFAYHILNINEF